MRAYPELADLEETNQLLAMLREHNVRRAEYDEHLKIEALRTLRPPDLAARIAECKPRLLTLLLVESDLLGMSLTELEGKGLSMVEVFVPWLDQTLWFTRGIGPVQALKGRGVHRGRVWTEFELARLCGVPRLGEEELRFFVSTKLRFVATLDAAS